MRTSDASGEASSAAGSDARLMTCHANSQVSGFALFVLCNSGTFQVSNKGLWNSSQRNSRERTCLP